MSADSSRDQDLKQRELDLKERELKIRMRELEAELEAQKKSTTDDDAHTATIPKEIDLEALAHQRKLRRIILFGKFALLAAGIAIAVVVLNVLLFPMIVISALGAILYGAYILLLKESSTNTDIKK